MLSSTPRSSAGWPVASSHALLASSRTPSRSAPVMASPSGRSGAGPSLARDGRSLPSPLPTSERGLCLGSVTVLPAEHRPLPEGGPAHPVLGEPVCRLCLISKGCLLFPWQIKVLFSRPGSCHAEADFTVSSTSLVMLGRHPLKQGTSGGSMVKNLPANAGDMGPIPGSGKSVPHMPRGN